MDQGYSYEKAAGKLGTTGFSVRNWAKKFQQSGELAQLKMENDTLKKAAAYFAKESL